MTKWFALGCLGLAACPGWWDPTTGEVEDCVVRVAEPDGAEAVVLGAIVDRTGERATVGAAAEAAVVQAARDFNEHATLQGGAAVSLVVCDAKSSDEGAQVAAAYFQSMAVPAVIGPSAEDQLAEVVDEVVYAEEPRFLVHSPQAIAEPGLDELDLVWHTNAVARHRGRAVGLHLAKEAARGLIGEDGEKPTVAVFTRLGGFGDGFRAGLMSEEDEMGSLVVPEAELQIAFRFVGLDDAKIWLDSVNTTIDALVIAGGDEVADLLEHWDELRGSWPRRVYIDEGSLAAVLAREGLGLPGGLRVIGVEPEGAAAAAVRARVGVDAPEVAFTYDAAMVTLLAMAAVPAGEAIDGRGVAMHMLGFDEAPADAAGITFADDPAEFVPAAVSVLAAGQQLRAVGAGGRLDYRRDGAACREVVVYEVEGTALTPVDTLVVDCKATGGAIEEFP